MGMSNPHLETIGVAMHVAAERRSAKHQRRTRRTMLVALAAPLALGGGSAIAGVVDVGPLADQLAVFRSDAPVGTPAPAPLKEIARLAATDVAPADAPDATAARPLASTADGQTAVLAMRAGNKVCLTLTNATAGIGHCITALAGHEVQAQLGIVDSRAYIWGVVADDVTNVTITTAHGDITATIGENGFVAPVTLAQAACKTTVTATSPAGTTTQTIAAVPTVDPSSISAPDANGVSSARSLTPDC